MNEILSDDQLINLCDPTERRIRTIELLIVHRLINSLARAGYTLAYSDGQDVYKNTKKQVGVNILFSADEAVIYIYKNDKREGYVKLVMGNSGVDIIYDYSVNIENIISSILSWIERLERRGSF